jgi:hypothetical protein
VKRWAQVCLLIASVLCWSAGAYAQGDQERDAARALADSAFAFYEKGEYANALERFTQAEKIVHAPPHLLYIARCHDKLGALFAARKAYSNVMVETLANDAPPAFADAQRTAKSELAALNARIPSITVTVVGPPAEATQVKLAGKPLAIGETLELEPGSYEVSARAEGWLTQSRTVELTAGSKESISFSLQQVGSEQPVPEPPDNGDTAASDGPSVLLPVVLIGVGGAGLLVGAITGGLALGKADDLKTACPIRSICGPENQSLEDDARAMGTASTVSFVIGGVFAAAGVTWLIVTLASSDTEEAPSSVTLRVGPMLTLESTF